MMLGDLTSSNEAARPRQRALVRSFLVDRSLFSGNSTKADGGEESESVHLDLLERRDGISWRLCGVV